MAQVRIKPKDSGNERDDFVDQLLADTPQKARNRAEAIARGEAIRAARGDVDLDAELDALAERLFPGEEFRARMSRIIAEEGGYWPEDGE